MCGVSSDVPCARAGNASTNKIAANNKTRHVPEYVVVCAITAHPQGSDGFAGAVAWLMGSKGQHASFRGNGNSSPQNRKPTSRRSAPRNAIATEFLKPQKSLGRDCMPKSSICGTGR